MKQHKAFTLIELIAVLGCIVVVGAIIAACIVIPVSLKNMKPAPVAQAPASQPAIPTPAEVDEAPAQPSPAVTLTTQTATPAPAVAVQPVPTNWGYIPSDGHTGFWVWSLFFPRLTILATHHYDHLPHCSIPYWGKFFMALLIPRVLIIVMLFQAGLQTSLWMILHALFFLMVCFKGSSYCSHRN